MSIALDFNEFSSLTDADFDLIETYNKDDCLATNALHDWIESIYQEQIKIGAALSRLKNSTGEANEHITDSE